MHLQYGSSPYRRRLLLAIFPLVSVLAGCADVRWEYDFPAAENKARLEQKDLVVYFRNWRSPHCGRIEREWLPRAPDVQQALRNTINCWLEWDFSQEIARKYRVGSSPSFLVVRPSGEHQTLAGPLSKEQFLAFLNRASGSPTTRPPPSARQQPR